MSAEARWVVRALGVAAAALWAWLALATPAAWPRAGFLALGIALAASLALAPVTALVPRVVLLPPRRWFVAAAVVAAAGLSAWELRRALHGHLLSIDSGIYLLQARALAHGHVGLLAPHPAQAFGDRFVLEGPDGLLYGVFPPGWPLALAPFAALGHPMAAGPAAAALLVVAQAALGRAVGRAAGDEDAGELATRLSILLSLASIGRALETADLLSHAFVAALAAFAVAGALALRREDRPARARLCALGVGACVGWATASRLLDGVVLGAAVAGLLAWRRAGLLRALAWSAAGAAPFALLLAVEQHAATGAWLLPTQTTYFARSDWPPTCHRLGFGPDVGCTVEHPGPVSRLGGDGYGPSDAVVVVRERAGALGEDLVGWAPLLLVAFAPVAVAASGVDAVALAFVLALTLAYGLFYYGNVMFFGARHLFPVAAFAWLLVARGALLARGARLRGAGVAAALAVAVTGGVHPWRERTAGASGFQDARSDLRRTVEERHVERGILKTHDLASFAGAFDPWARDDRHVFALDDDSGLLDLRRMHPELPVLLSLPGDQIGRLYAGRPPPGLLVELERLWPTFVRPSGLASRQATQQGASGGNVLLLSHAGVGASLVLPFDVAVPDTYRVRVDAVSGPDAGDYALSLDGTPLPDLRGYAPQPGRLRGAEVARELSATRHVLVARCTGKDPASTGYDARLDAIVGEP